ncbi:MAG: oligopeptidase A [Hyphomicrobiaceae bacterium]|jgi:oligopeptidase A
MKTHAPETTNPLLCALDPFPFDQVDVADVEPAVDGLLVEVEAALAAIETDIAPTWEATIGQVERIQDRIARIWGTTAHLMSVRNSPALREAFARCQPRIVEFIVRLQQSRPLYDALVALRAGPLWSSLDSGRRRIVDGAIRDAELSGVGLRGATSERFAAVQSELAQLGTTFGNNLLDATSEFSIDIDDPMVVEGMPSSLLSLAARNAVQARGADTADTATPENGPWRFTLDAPSLMPFLEHCRDRDLRKKVYLAHVTRASAGAHDNTPIIEKILALRTETARLLGDTNYAQVSLRSKMAGNVAAVNSLLERLREACLDAARDELGELQVYAANRGGPSAEHFSQWDVAFWAERLREDRYGLCDDELRPYFPLPVVLDGLFALTKKLFGVTIRSADGEVPVWHADVRFFRVAVGDGREIAHFYLDPYSRPAEKRGGAWMNGAIGRSQGLSLDSKPRLPTAYLVCNQSPSDGDRPSLMSFGEVRTLFHEFGHALQHMLTTVDDSLVAGIQGVEWDAVEIASQFMENWCYERETIRACSGHVDTGAELPDALLEKLREARSYRAGSNMLRQVYFALVDLALHGDACGDACDDACDDGERDAFDVQREVSKRATVMPVLDEDRFLASFSHIFGGGYAAGYYSYKWAEVMSADAFAAFEEVGLDNEAAVREVGRRYRDTILALGGSVAPAEVFSRFRGRDPDPSALLRHSGLAR